MKALHSGGWIVTCDDAGTEYPSGWLLVEDGLVAAVGDGDEPDAAHEAAKRTVAFYTTPPEDGPGS